MVTGSQLKLVTPAQNAPAGVPLTDLEALYDAADCALIRSSLDWVITHAGARLLPGGEPLLEHAVATA